jgi:4-aminobutyrate aminotransferase
MMQPVRGEGTYLYDAHGNAFMDFTSGMGVTNTGHCHPRVVQAVQEQASTLLFSQINITIPPATVALAEALDRITPPTINRFFFANSGAEAVESAVKLARHATKKPNIVVFQGGAHGRTAQTQALTTSRGFYRQSPVSLPSGILVAPFPDAKRYGWDEDTTVDFCLKQFDHLLRTQTLPSEVAAVLIEPMLGEGGCVPAPDSFLQRLRAVCAKYNILLIVDEVQTGMGRTGKWFGYEHAAIEPDIIVMAKALGSGLPISCVASRRELMDKWVTGSHGGTFGGGSAVASAAACATIEAIEQDNLLANAVAMGESLVNSLGELQVEYRLIGDVRGRGLMVAAELVNGDGQPDKDICSAVVRFCAERRLLLAIGGTYENVVRWLPPLNVTQEQLDEALTIFEEALQSVMVAVR